MPKAQAKKDENDNQGSQIDPEARLRDIQTLLFGEQQSHLEQVIAELKQNTDASFDRLEKRFDEALAAMKKDVNAQFQSLDKHVEELNQAHLNREAELDGDIADLGKQLDSLRADSEAAHTALEKLMFEEVNRLADDTDAKCTELNEALERSNAELDDKKTDRAALAKLFTDVAKKLDSA